MILPSVYDMYMILLKRPVVNKNIIFFNLSCIFEIYGI